MEYGKINKFTKGLLDFMFYTGILVLATVPVWLKLAGRYYSSELRENYWFMLLTFAASGICGIFIVNELRKMMRTVLAQNCFVRPNVKSLRKMSGLSFAIAVFFVLKCVFVLTPATLIIVLVFLVAGLFSIVLSCVFAEAIDYKEENELTI